MILSLEKYLEIYCRDVAHANEVRRLALIIFDEVCKNIKELSNKSRKMLDAAALLHDIGYSAETKGHNKQSQKIILQNGIEGFSAGEIALISCVARYHKGSLPDKKEHEVYNILDKKDRKIVKRLGGILRIADGLDRAHCGLIKKVKIQFDEENSIAKFVVTPKDFEYRPDLTYAIRKRDLFEIGFKCQTYLVFSEN